MLVSRPIRQEYLVKYSESVNEQNLPFSSIASSSLFNFSSVRGKKEALKLSILTELRCGVLASVAAFVFKGSL